MRVLFVQGGGKDTHDAWDNRLVDSLSRALGRDYDVRYPRMPDEANPEYDRWAYHLRTELGKLDDRAVVVGHSIGGTVLVNVLAAEPPRVALGGIFLVAAPFVGAGGWPTDGFEPPADLGSALPPGVPVYIYHGSDDDIVPAAHVDLYVDAIPGAVVHRLGGRDHQLGNDLSEVARDIRALT